MVCQAWGVWNDVGRISKSVKVDLCEAGLGSGEEKPSADFKAFESKEKCLCWKDIFPNSPKEKGKRKHETWSMWKKRGIKVSARSLISCPQEVFGPWWSFFLWRGGCGEEGASSKPGRADWFQTFSKWRRWEAGPCGLLPGRSGRLVALPQSCLFLDHATHWLVFHFILFAYLFLIVFILKGF